MSTTPIRLDRPDGKGLAAGTLGLWGSTVIGLASTAPVYSLVATLGFVVLAVGAQAPIAFVVAFVPMLFIAFAYRELNNAVPDCGTTFTWGTKAFGPWVGWMGGWGVAVAGMVVLANLAQIGGIYFWALVDGIIGSSGDALLSDNVPLVTATGVVFIALMTWISWRGVEIGERVQNVLLAIQYLALAIFVVAALWHYFAGSAPAATPSRGTGSTRSPSRSGPGSPRRSCWRCSSTGAGTPASPSTRRRRIRSAFRGSRRSSPACCCCSPTSRSPSRP